MKNITLFIAVLLLTVQGTPIAFSAEPAPRPLPPWEVVRGSGLPRTSRQIKADPQAKLRMARPGETMPIRLGTLSKALLVVAGVGGFLTVMASPISEEWPSSAIQFGLDGDLGVSSEDYIQWVQKGGNVPNFYAARGYQLFDPKQVQNAFNPGPVEETDSGTIPLKVSSEIKKAMIRFCNKYPNKAASFWLQFDPKEQLVRLSLYKFQKILNRLLLITAQRKPLGISFKTDMRPHEIVITLADTGPVLSREEINTFNSGGRGSALTPQVADLLRIKRIVESEGGHFQVFSVPGFGNNVRIYFPSKY